MKLLLIYHTHKAMRTNDELNDDDEVEKKRCNRRRMNWTNWLAFIVFDFGIAADAVAAKRETTKR